MPLPDAPPPYRTVVFDCDSTLSAIEGVEELAGPEHAAEVARLTEAAMAGEVPLEAVFGARLALVRPSRTALEEVARRYVRAALPNARELVAALRSAAKRVVVVSGGLLPAVGPFGAWLGADEVHAVDVRFDAEGGYAGFDEASPLARAGGKIAVLSALAAGGAPLAFVGDGATDLEAAHLAARFVAFGGVVRRENVFRAARVRTTARDLAALVPLLLAPEETAALARSAEHAALLASAP